MCQLSGLSHSEVTLALGFPLAEQAAEDRLRRVIHHHASRIVTAVRLKIRGFVNGRKRAPNRLK